MMNGKMKRLLAGLMCLVMVVGLLPVTAGATETELADGYYYIGNGKYYVAADGGASTEPYACYVEADNGVYYIKCGGEYLAPVTAISGATYVDAGEKYGWQWDGTYFYMTPATYGAAASYICYSSDVTGGLGLTTDRSAAFTATAVSDSAEDVTTVDEITNVPAVIDNSSTEFIRAFALDCGRIYFSVEDIKEIIDVMAANDYTHLTLAFGNSGFRFLLDDMKIGDYSSDAVKNAILAGNTYYATNDGHNGSSAANTCLTQSDMDTIIFYANSKGIEIIPALNSPGHMNTIVYAMGQLGISDAGYPVSNSYNSESTIDITNENVTTFVSALLQKYITYFADKDCTYFNLGADEFANDPTDDTKLSGFTSMSNDLKTSFINYVNSAATLVSNAGMIPMMFNDGYAWSDAEFNKDIVVCYWTSGAVSSTAIANAGHNVINNSQSFYYVLGEPFGTYANSWCSYASATNGVNNVPVTQMVDGGTPDKLIGSQMFLWCDYTDEVYTEEEETKVHTLIATLAENNPDYFDIPEEPETREVTVMVNQTVTDTVENVAVSGTIETADSTIATAAGETFETEEAHELVQVNSLSDIVSGEKYVLVNKRSDHVLGNTTGNASTWGTTCLVQDENTASVSSPYWTITKTDDSYYLQNPDGQYLTIGNNSSNLTSNATALTVYDYNNNTFAIGQNGYYLNDMGNAGQFAGGYNVLNDGGAPWYLYRVVDSDAATNTRVTFTGVAVGTTTATVGHVTYTINVIAEDLSAVTLTYHPWLSNYSVHAEGTGASNCNGNLGVANPQTIAATSTGVNSESGAVFADLVWATGDWRWEEDAQTVFWKGTVLDEEHKQEGNGADDMCMSGTDFTYIRYWGGQWSYSSDRVTWTAVKDTDEVCAYYLQKTEVTTEVTTYLKDWAFTAENAAGREETRYQKALSFAVVYPGGTMNPSEENIYANSTLIYWDNLEDLGFIRIGLSGDYEIDKITYTFGERATTDNVNWTSNETINWEKTTINDEEWYDETVCWDKSYGTEPVVNGADLSDVINAGDATSGTTGYNGTWGANDAVLILIYLEPVATEDSLTVIYYDEKFGDTLHDYSIIVNPGVNFKNGIGEVTTDAAGNVTINTDVKPGTFKEGTSEENENRIDVTGFGITNKVPVAESFQTDLTKVPDARGKYRSELYTYTGSVISEDGKTLYLYYNIDTSVLSPNFVIDFGLPITFPLTDLLGEGTEPEDVEAVSGLSARYGVLTYDETDKIFNYRPTSVINTIDILSISLTIDGKTATSNVGVTPASNVLYEDTFLGVNTTTGTSYKAWSHTDGSAPTQSTDQTTLYGYDDAYQKSTENSLGSAWTVSDMTATGTTAGSQYLTTTFTGEGFDLIGTAGPDTGMVYLLLNGPQNKMVIVDTCYVDGNGTTLYQVPLAHEMLTEGTYTVNIRGRYRAASGTQPAGDASRSTYSMTGSSAALDEIYAAIDEMFMDGMDFDDVEFVYFDESSPLAELENSTYAMTYTTDTGSTSSGSTDTYRPAGTTVTIDGFRVYRSTENTDYLESEQGLTYQNVLEATLDGTVNDDGEVVFTAYVENTDGQDWTLSSYEKNGGPQNEVYLGANNSDAIAFKVGTAATTVQISARAVGIGSANLVVNGTVVKTIECNTEMYYEVTSNSNGIITITNTGEGMLALGNLKYNVTSGASMMMLSEEDYIEVYSLLSRPVNSGEEVDDGTETPEQPETPSQPSTPVKPGVPSIIWPTYTPSQPDVFRPDVFEMDVDGYTLFGKRFVTIVVETSTDVSKLTINGVPVWASNYLWVKSGQDDNYRFTMLLVLDQGEKANFQVVAYDKKGVASKTYTITD